MPVDSGIALQGKPPVLPEVDFNKTFLTLGQLRYLNSETARTQAQAGLLETQGAVAQADFAEQQRVREVLARGADPTRQPLSSIGTGAVPSGGPPYDEATLAAPGSGPGQALPQGGQTPAPGAPAGSPPAGSPPQGAQPAPPRRTRAQLESQLLATGTKGIEAVKGLYANDATALANEKQALETRQARLTQAGNLIKDAHDQPSWDLALAWIEHTTGQPTDHLPQVYSPEAKAQLMNTGRSVQQEIEQQNLVIKQKQDDLRIQNESVQAKAAAQQAETARIEALKKQAVPTGTGFVTFNPVTGAWERATTPAPSGGQTPVTSPAQVATAREMNQGWMNATGNQQFLQSKQGMTDMETGATLGTGAGDRAVVTGYSRVMGGSTAATAEDIMKLGTLTEQAVREVQRLFTTGEQLSPAVRQELLTAARAAYKTRVAQHQQNRKYTIDMSKDLGVQNPETVIPDLSTDTQAPPAPGKPERANLAPPPPGSSKPVEVKSVSLKELQQTVDLANKQGRKTPTGQPFTMDYLKDYFEKNGVQVRP